MCWTAFRLELCEAGCGQVFGDRHRTRDVPKVYKELRTVGLYPAGSDPAKPATVDDISLLELVCEVGELRRWQVWIPCGHSRGLVRAESA